ncbi:hypothetical protein PTTG_00871 [Puccinia triticina 1-1 BBBD Race 1]|uniref:Uncharacterized protein n=1 Tax=Puccinia triticina (isolate 1-1 / race 1 (BBBD)) TaxID=630390 RepID=A0A0C4EJF3_PUCT1|nr:hypothetical protein PTTG_00871 [Puccinia triticina 1-1 BBBD Race 1]
MEESEEIKPADKFVAEDIILDVPEPNVDNIEGEEIGSNDGSSDEDEFSKQPSKSKNPVNAILKKVNFVIQRITCSAAKRSKYNTWCQKLDYDGPSLIAGYGIRWNIKFQSRDRGYKARQIISKLLENERDRQERKGGKNYYNNVEILRDKWFVVNKLNNMLSKMEGDHSSACLMISEYRYIKAFIKEKIRLTTSAESEF